MNALFRITFADGSAEAVEAPNADEAKSAAKVARARALDPLGNKPRSVVRKHASVKVAKVEEIPHPPAPRADRVLPAAAPTAGPEGN